MFLYFTASGWAASRGRLAKVRERELNVPSMADGTFPVSLGFISHFHLGERFEIGPFRILGKKNTLNKRKGDWTNLLTVAFKAGRRKKILKQRFVFLIKEKCHQVLMKSELLYLQH